MEDCFHSALGHLLCSQSFSTISELKMGPASRWGKFCIPVFPHLFHLCHYSSEQAQFLLTSLIASFAHNISSSTLHLFVFLVFYSQASPSTPASFLSHLSFPHLPHPLHSPQLLLLLQDQVVLENACLCQGRRWQV